MVWQWNMATGQWYKEGQVHPFVLSDAVNGPGQPRWPTVALHWTERGDFVMHTPIVDGERLILQCPPFDREGAFWTPLQRKRAEGIHPVLYQAQRYADAITRFCAQQTPTQALAIALHFTKPPTPLEALLATHQEVWGEHVLIAKNFASATAAIDSVGGWRGGVTPYTPCRLPHVALCLPLLTKGVAYTEWFAQIPSPYRIMSEVWLDLCWDRLEVLYVCRALLSEWGTRKVRGFEATGGTVIDLKVPAGHKEENME